MTVQAVILAIEAKLQSVSGLHQASAIKPEGITTPAAIVGVPPVEDYQQAFARSKYLLRPTITVLTSTAIDRVGQLKLSEFVSLSGPSSIPAAIHQDPTLGGVAESAEVESFRPFGIEDIGRIGYYGGLFVLRVMVKEEL